MHIHVPIHVEVEHMLVYWGVGGGRCVSMGGVHSLDLLMSLNHCPLPSLAPELKTTCHVTSHVTVVPYPPLSHWNGVP